MAVIGSTLSNDLAPEVVVRLSGDLTVSTVAELRSDLLREISTGAAVCMDLSETNAIDAAVVQLLITAERAPGGVVRPIAWDTLPASAQSSLHDLGFGHLLQGK